MSEAVYHGVDEANKLIVKKQMRRGHREAGQARRERLATSTRRWCTTTSGFAYSSKNDYANAAKAFAKAVALKALPQQQHEQLQFNLGQLYIVAGQHDEGIKTLQEYITGACTPLPRRGAHLSGQCAHREEAISRRPCRRSTWRCRKPRPPIRPGCEMKLAINYELKDFKACAAVLVQLIGLAPDEARLLEAAFEHVLRDEAGHGGRGGAGGRGTPGVHRQAQRAARISSTST